MGDSDFVHMRNRKTSKPDQGDAVDKALGDRLHEPKQANPSLVFQRNALLLSTAVLAILLVFTTQTRLSAQSMRKNGGCDLYFEPYRGDQYFSEESGSMGSPKCLIESKWLKVSQHTVKFPGSDNLIDDWMWIDYHDRINVLVEDEDSQPGNRKFLIFKQTKYALEGRMSKAIIGGIIEPGEDPETAARREVDEEMNGLQCDNFHFLGRYRTDVNRGMGWVNGFLATQCSRMDTHKHQSLADEVGAADSERQDLVSISLADLKEAVRNGEFLEVQWTATVALALLHPELMIQ